jgi:hypothetical protein
MAEPILNEPLGSYDFSKQHSIGSDHEKALDEFFQRRYFVYPATREEQRTGIDRWFADEDECFLSVEYKADSRAHKTGNAFIETISVDTRYVLGWAYTSQAEALCYYLPSTKKGWLICFKALRSCLPRWVETYPTRKVKNFDYCTHGLLVPMQKLVDIAFEEFSLD